MPHGIAVGQTLSDIPEMFRGPFGELLGVEIVTSSDVLLDRDGHELVIPEWNVQVYQSRFSDGTVIRAVSAPRCAADGTLLGTRLSMVVAPTGD